MRNIKLVLLAALAGMAFSGCEKSASTATPTNPSASLAPPAGTVARIHWLGKKRVAAETNAPAFMQIWNQPESAKLEAQILDKLSTAPWRLLPRVATTNRAAAQLLRSLLDDLVQEESYLEVLHPTNRSGELVFAIRLDSRRAGAWETNLAAVLESLTRIHPATDGNRRGWSLKKHHPPNLIELVRAGEWTLVGAGQEHNRLLEDMVARIQRDQAPFTAPATNFWLEAHVDLPGVAGAWSSNRNFAGFLPEIAFNVMGDGTNVRTRGELKFPAPLRIALEPWRIPTNLVQEPLISFVAARGVAPWLGRIKFFSGLRSSDPGQIYLWDRAGTPFQTYFAMPVNNATDALKAVGPPITNWLNTVLGTNFGFAAVDTNLDSLVWQGLPFAFPFLEARTKSGQFLYGGLLPAAINPKRVMPAELAKHIVEGTNLIYFDWEMTGQKLIHWRYLDDVLRMLFDERGPLLRQESASMQWVAHSWTNLSHCATEVRLVDANRLSFARKSTVGFSGLELDLLANWIETPEFPGGFQALRITNQLPVDSKLTRRQNRPAATNKVEGTKSPVVAPRISP